MPQQADSANLKRIVAIDTLRGFALLGILLMNIMFYSMPQIASNPDRGVDAMHNGAVDNIVLAAQGQRPRWIVNANVWPGRMAGL